MLLVVVVGFSKAEDVVVSVDHFWHYNNVELLQRFPANIRRFEYAIMYFMKTVHCTSNSSTYIHMYICT